MCVISKVYCVTVPKMAHASEVFHLYEISHTWEIFRSCILQCVIHAFLTPVEFLMRLKIFTLMRVVFSCVLCGISHAFEEFPMLLRNFSCVRNFSRVRNFSCVWNFSDVIVLHTS